MKRIIVAAIVGILIMTCKNGCSCKNTSTEAAALVTNLGDSKIEYKNGDEIVIKFGAAWCGPCRILSKTIKNSGSVQKHIKEETKGLFDIDIDAKDDITKAWVAKAKVSSIPLVVRYTYKDGNWIEHSRFLGVRQEKELMQFLTSR